MAGKKTFVFLLLIIFLLAGCQNTEDKSDKWASYTVDYTEKNVDNTVTYIVDERSFKYKKTVTGRTPNAAYDSYYIILTNDEDITFKEVDNRFYGSHKPSVERFVIVEVGSILEE